MDEALDHRTRGSGWRHELVDIDGSCAARSFEDDPNEAVEVVPYQFD